MSDLAEFFKRTGWRIFARRYPFSEAAHLAWMRAEDEVASKRLSLSIVNLRIGDEFVVVALGGDAKFDTLFGGIPFELEAETVEILVERRLGTLLRGKRFVRSYGADGPVVSKDPWVGLDE